MKKILSIVFLILMVIFISGCTKEKTSGSPKTKKIINTITALEAWEKVKPKADEWSNSYKIASISDISTANYQRIDGQAIGWQFYLEECQKYYTGSMSQTCKKGKTRTFYYHTENLLEKKKE